jgi:outer membrane protein OmpA-like peptidoglycan-associated protein
MNITGPVNTGTTKTVAIGSGSVARDFYSVSSAGINPTGNSSFTTRIAALDQRGVARAVGSRIDVGAYEVGEDLVVVPVAAVQTPAVITKATVAKQTIKFSAGSSKLSSASKKTLRTLATEIQAKGLKTVNLEGYTATLTEAAPSGKVFRVKLSKARTVAVEKYLKEQFKKANYSVTFIKSPKGAANRVKSNKTEKGRIDNRRVEIAIN